VFIYHNKNNNYSKCPVVACLRYFQFLSVALNSLVDGGIWDTQN